LAVYQRGDLFTEKLNEMYGYTQETLNDLLASRESYEANPPDYPKEIELLKIYDLHQQVNGSDSEISDALLATCYWFIYHNFQTTEPEYVELDEKGNERLLMNLLADSLIKRYCIVSESDISYLYINDKYYENKHRLSQDIVKTLKRCGYSDMRKIEPIVRDILYRIKKETMKHKEFPFNKKSQYLIPVANGVVVRKNLNLLLPKSPVWGFTYVLPVNYDKEADSTPIRTFINEIVDGDDRAMLIQIPAQALMQNSNYQLSYLCTGEGSNGKSVYLNLLQNLVGHKSTTSVSLQELIENRFASADLQGKLLNVYADLPRYGLKDTGRFKILTGGDTIPGERKFADRFTFQNKAVFVFSGNELPTVEDSSYSFWRRWAVIEFPHRFKVDPTFIDKLIAPKNLSGFLNLVIEDMNRIESHGVLRTAKIEQIMELWKMRSNSAYAFIKNRLEKSPKKWISKNVLWNEYNQYCIDNEFTEVSKIKFRQQLDRDFAVEDTYVIDENRSRIQVLKGITFKDPNADPTPSKKKGDDTVEAQLEAFKE
jgi:putative DNA primase/helicase